VTTFSARVVEDSYYKQDQIFRVSTLEVTYPRIIHAEMLRHRDKSRCVSSSRAIPIQKFIDQVNNNPHTPVYWGLEQSGMQASTEMPQEDRCRAEGIWLRARDSMVGCVQELKDLRAHKQNPNRLLEPFQLVTEVITATDWSNFFNLRIHPAAAHEITKISELMKSALESSQPKLLGLDGWHLPYVSEDERSKYSAEITRKLGVGRSARVSYDNLGREPNVEKDTLRADGMIKHAHMSPLEHVVRRMTPEEIETVAWVYGSETGPVGYPKSRSSEAGTIYRTTHYCGNLDGFVSYRKTIPYEFDLLGQTFFR